MRIEVARVVSEDNGVWLVQGKVTDGAAVAGSVVHAPDGRAWVLVEFWVSHGKGGGLQMSSLHSLHLVTMASSLLARI